MAAQLRTTRSLGFFALILCLANAPVALAQQSTSFQLEEHAFNAGGHPEAGEILISASFRLSLGSLGEGVAAIPLVSASFGMEGGFASAYPPPREVSGLRFLDVLTLEWDPERSAGTYNLYRDLISNLQGLGYGSCELRGLPDADAMDTAPLLPPPGDGYFYLATVENRLLEEGTKGYRSGGPEREGTLCP